MAELTLVEFMHMDFSYHLLVDLLVEALKTKFVGLMAENRIKFRVDLGCLEP